MSSNSHSAGAPQAAHSGNHSSSLQQAHHRKSLSDGHSKGGGSSNHNSSFNNKRPNDHLLSLGQQGIGKRPRVRDYVGHRAASSSSSNRHNAAAIMAQFSGLLPPLHTQVTQFSGHEQLQPLALPLVKPRSGSEHRTNSQAKESSSSSSSSRTVTGGASGVDADDAPLNLCMKKPSSSSAPSRSSSTATNNRDVANVQRSLEAHAQLLAQHQERMLALATESVFPKKRGRKPKSLLVPSSSGFSGIHAGAGHSGGGGGHHSSSATSSNLPIIVVPSTSNDNRPRKRGRPPILSPPPSMGVPRAGRGGHHESSASSRGMSQLEMISNRLASAGGALPTQLQPGWPTFSSTGQIIFPNSKNANGNSSSNRLNIPAGIRDSTSRSGSESVRPSENDESETDEESDVSRPDLRETVNEEDLRLPLKFGWRRHTIIKRISTSGVKGDILYFSPDGKRLKNINDVIKVCLCSLLCNACCYDEMPNRFLSFQTVPIEAQREELIKRSL